MPPKSDSKTANVSAADEAVAAKAALDDQAASKEAAAKAAADADAAKEPAKPEVQVLAEKRRGNFVTRVLTDLKRVWKEVEEVVEGDDQGDSK